MTEFGNICHCGVAQYCTPDCHMYVAPVSQPMNLFAPLTNLTIDEVKAIVAFHLRKAAEYKDSGNLVYQEYYQYYTIAVCALNLYLMAREQSDPKS